MEGEKLNGKKWAPPLLGGAPPAFKGGFSSSKPPLSIIPDGRGARLRPDAARARSPVGSNARASVPRCWGGGGCVCKRASRAGSDEMRTIALNTAQRFLMAGLQVTLRWRWNSFRRQIRRQIRTCARRRQFCSRSSKKNRCLAEQRLRLRRGWLRRFMGAMPRCPQVAGRAVPRAPLKPPSQSVADRLLWILSHRDTEHRGTQARWNARTHARQILERFSLEVISINRH